MGTDLVDQSGSKMQLYGMSTHGIAWFPDYINYDTFRFLRDDWGANCIRLAMYSGENSGYCTGGDKQWLKGLVNNGVEYATELGMYVIIDWHVLGDRTPMTYKEEAKKFFDEMSSRYADYPNVIYEICNEPNGGTSWSEIAAYANEVIPIIRANSPDSIVIVGTPTWSQEVDKPAANPLQFDNVMYALHFYADTHRDGLRNTMVNAIRSGAPIFITEFGMCDASGNGAVNESEANKWKSLIDEHNISYMCWNLANKGESSSIIRSGCSKLSGWTDDDLSTQGRIIRSWRRNADY
ncbi:MAG: glycoside hydrolase family 5 protein [Oscillospiraceae bacterium]|nr:glycoside hydrolase family 5 protein [Oscillospiraceae bacterium]